MSANWLMRRRETLKRPIHFVLSFCRYILDICTTELGGTLVQSLSPWHQSDTFFNLSESVLKRKVPRLWLLLAPILTLSPS